MQSTGVYLYISEQEKGAKATVASVARHTIPKLLTEE